MSTPANDTLGFDGAVGEALRLTREGASPHQVIPSVLERITDATARAAAAKAGVEARVWQILNQDRARRDEAERRATVRAAGGGVPCLAPDCSEPIVRIERYKSTVVWDRQQDGSWSMGVEDVGTHFHLFCAYGHETRAWNNHDPNADGVLPAPLRAVVYPGG